MKKTNIRVNNFFIVEDKGKYYTSDIDVLEDWNLLSKKELKKYITADISDKLDKLMETHSLQMNVNFIVEDMKVTSKVIELKDKKQSGG
tara:strand:+ start:254 stop:520 length:267 start_codon:yes stop_codon:yes gene_type:complete